MSTVDMIRERPLLFIGPMVRALLDGSKTQTRREVKLPAGHYFAEKPDYPLQILVDGKGDDHGSEYQLQCPYGKPGDRIWVRENGWERPIRTAKQMREGADTWERYYYDADGLTEQDRADFKAWGFKRRPSIHMPRWASRITLEIVSVRVERLQDISEADAKEEGAEPNDGYMGPDEHRAKGWVKGYRQIWKAINGPESWAANPWVWVIEFRRVQ